MFYRVDKTLKRADRLAWIEQHCTVSKLPWISLEPDKNSTWLVPEFTTEFDGFIPIGSKQGKAAKPGRAQVVFKQYSLGVATHRDSVVYDFNKERLADRMVAFIEMYNVEVDRYRRVASTVNPNNFTWSEKVIWDRRANASNWS